MGLSKNFIVESYKGVFIKSAKLRHYGSWRQICHCKIQIIIALCVDQIMPSDIARGAFYGPSNGFSILNYWFMQQVNLKCKGFPELLRGLTWLPPRHWEFFGVRFGAINLPSNTLVPQSTAQKASINFRSGEIRTRFSCMRGTSAATVLCRPQDYESYVSLFC